MNIPQKTLLLSALLLFSNRGFAQQFKIDSTGFFNPSNFVGDTLYINASFRECGEWGGHAEVSKIYVSGRDFYVTYQLFSADCNRIINGKPLQILTKTITKKISDEGTFLIQSYFHELAEAKLNEPEPMQSGYIFQIAKKGNGLNLWVYTWYDKTKNEYLELIKMLIE